MLDVTYRATWTLVSAMDGTLVQLKPGATERPSFRRLYETYGPDVFAHLVLRTRDRALGEDLTAETFERALRAYPRFEPQRGRTRAWLLRIADSAYADHFRRAQRRPLTVPADPDITARSSMLSAEAAALRQAEVTRIYAALDALPSLQRTVVLMRLGQSLSHADIARLLDRKEGAVRMIYSRALARLRDTLKDGSR